ncbi:transcriptional regulator [Halomarina pelagica]|uniref:transcriptional regulator n=1 Tax=Halomarina pelagica TaxID=2961599 RepID=UPI0020C5113D|nr:transcriptional regulator [Halomarina sp. BND7]
MGDRTRTESGQYAETVTLSRVLRVFDQVEGPVITSSDVATILGCSTEAARQKLATLHDRGDVHRRTTGRTVVYWRDADATIDDAFDPDDPLFADPPIVTGGDPVAVEDIDDVLYGSIETDGDGETDASP